MELGHHARQTVQKASFTHIARGADGGGVGGAGDDEYRDPRQRGVGPHRGEKSSAVHHRQLEVEEDEIGPRQLAGHLEGLSPVGSDEDFAPLAPKDALDEGGGLGLVLGHENERGSGEGRERRRGGHERGEH